MFASAQEENTEIDDEVYSARGSSAQRALLRTTNMLHNQPCSITMNAFEP